jgi:flagellar biosynthesis protein FlhA
MLGRALGRNQDLLLVGAVISILLILFAPIPSLLLDLLIILNFAFALTMLMLTFYVQRPVEFSTFPSLLLVATLFRLSLNIAATRLILTDGHAGDVIQAIGSFAVQGSFVIGLVVFFILVVVQYVVVTSGAQRVSEVAARFVLDSMPGQQMSIDADLNMGLIDQEQAKQRRKDLEKEASFYGSMDGASKFVKGDAVAGIIILLINIFAGLIIGVAQMGMDWSTALQTFTLLTIGDGIVTQVPALIISTATGIIVTRSASDRQLSTEVFSQLASVPKIMLIVLVALLVLLALPGMPKWPIAILAVISIAAFIGARRRARRLAEEAPATVEGEPAAGAASEKGVAPVEIMLGSEIGRVWQGLKPLLAERVTALREQQEKASGFAIPSVVFQDDGQLPPLAYEVLLFGARHARGELRPEETLAVGGPPSGPRLPGVETRDPAFGLPALWIDPARGDEARRAGYTLVDPVTVLMTHLGEVLRSEASQLLTRADVVAILEGARTRQPGLVEELIPQIMTVSDVQRVLQNLLAEEVSIRNADQIIEAMVDVGRTSKDHFELTEAVRQRLAPVICHGLRGGRDQLDVLSLNPRAEAQLGDQLRHAGNGGPVVIDPRLAERLIRGLGPLVEKMMSSGLTPVLLCGPEIRRHLRTFTRRSLPRLAVLSVAEVPSSVELRSFAVLADEDSTSRLPALS